MSRTGSPAESSPKLWRGEPGDMTTVLAHAEHSLAASTHLRRKCNIPPLRLSPSSRLLAREILTMHPRPASFRALIRTSAPRVRRAPPAEHIPAPAKRLLHTPRTSPSVRPSRILPQLRTPCSIRYDSSLAAPSKPPTSTSAPDSRLEREQVPSYELTFTCNVCKTRSSHRLSKQGYHKGTILISCPDCKNRHLISDHLKVGRSPLSGLPS